MATENIEKLLHDVVRLACYIRVPFRDFLNDDQLFALVGTGERAAMTRVLRGKWADLDKRIRFVAAHNNGLPDGTIKLFDANKALEFKKGERINNLIDGGIIPFSVMKKGTPEEWYISGVYSFLPVDKINFVEQALEDLLQHFNNRDLNVKYAAHSVEMFQIRTGSSTKGYSVYLKANEYFSDTNLNL